MPNDLIYSGPVQTGAPSSPWGQGGTNRAVARIARGTELQVAQVGAYGQVELARLDAIDVVAGRALQGVALVSQLEQHLAAQNPFAAGRLQAIADMHTMAVGNEVMTFARRIQ
mgnify:CR=1 FL=1